MAATLKTSAQGPIHTLLLIYKRPVPRPGDASGHTFALVAYEQLLTILLQAAVLVTKIDRSHPGFMYIHLTVLTRDRVMVGARRMEANILNKHMMNLEWAPGQDHEWDCYSRSSPMSYENVRKVLQVKK